MKTRDSATGDLRLDPQREVKIADGRNPLRTTVQKPKGMIRLPCAYQPRMVSTRVSWVVRKWFFVHPQEPNFHVSRSYPGLGKLQAWFRAFAKVAHFSPGNLGVKFEETPQAPARSQLRLVHHFSRREFRKMVHRVWEGEQGKPQGNQLRNIQTKEGVQKWQNAADTEAAHTFSGTTCTNIATQTPWNLFFLDFLNPLMTSSQSCF